MNMVILVLLWKSTINSTKILGIFAGSDCPISVLLLVSDLEELDEGDDINIDNLNEILNTFPDNIEVSISIYSITLNFYYYYNF